jgi:mannose/fructose/N-acetylgalactosamine-specific phosphotransferase system component IID
VNEFYNTDEIIVDLSVGVLLSVETQSRNTVNQAERNLLVTLIANDKLVYIRSVYK